MKKMLLAALCAPLAMVAPAVSAATIFTSTFENVPGGPGFGGFTIVSTADGWTSTTNGIELQNHAAGDPAATGGNVFVELDTYANSSMSRTIADAGAYNLSFLYSPRPGVAASSNGIAVLVNGVSLFSVTGTGGANTIFSTVGFGFIAPTANFTLTFQAIGTSDSVGGYVDNITLSSVPEPATWATMIVGAGMIGGALRHRRRARSLGIA